MNVKKSALASAVAVTIGAGMATLPTSASAAIVTASWDGLFTMLDPGGVALTNTSKPYYYDATWGYGSRTQITGTFSFDTSTGAGSATVDPFEFFNKGKASAHDIVMQSIGGTLVAGQLLFDWSTATNINVGIILDAAGFFGALGAGVSTSDIISGTGAVPASDGIAKGKLPIGASPMATTTFDTNFHNDPTCVMSGTCAIADGTGIGGDPMDNGPFPGFNANFDVTSIHITSFTAVPVPAAVWLFGSGLLGLVGVARRKKQS